MGFLDNDVFLNVEWDRSCLKILILTNGEVWEMLFTLQRQKESEIIIQPC